MTTNTQEINFQQQELKGRDFLTLADYTKDEINYLIDLADYLKKQHKDGVIFEPLKGKTLGMIFEKSSTRTRVSFETGIYQLGGLGIFLSSKDIQIGRGETIADTAKVLSGYLDGIMIRTFAQEDVEELAKHASIPVINGLTDLYHPCQVLADLQTIKEVKGKLHGVKLVYIGDGNNMTHSLMLGAAKTGMHMVAVTPDGYTPNKEVLTKAKSIANQHGAIIEWTSDIATAVQEADVIYTDVWASMGQEEEQQQREKDFENYQVNESLLEKAKTDVIFMHCLPAHRGEEVTAGVIDGKQSVVFQQAENRLHAQKALMTALMAD
ncbi:ornithine carbamoyltransferase [Oceanobacillus iheyensis HTE831]|uniref:Ornithine carbamoyltransferase n=1 Tax=Oceanobacillus iheyensis (strain DSM 14371 / CIP 107618 / JCM 11309 / KCTC 3954 / HTE831) TaxID=221109 RepID=OTC_OCEIH|nr:ornithine carbamoyltransferase [Oceanobacillus iheyensis]Q8ET05.1 RecName: Full=Ornithine carbamoyltransferase; Short=OTCase [Oceanobacillus iheyensis HTE831]BAC12416.1 ornithine carbamoyltransferase [Oceanobacillus iheyensis HTE831]